MAQARAHHDSSRKYDLIIIPKCPRRNPPLDYAVDEVGFNEPHTLTDLDEYEFHG